MDERKDNYMSNLINISKAGNPYWKQRMSTVDLLVRTSSYQLLFMLIFSVLQNNYFNEEANCTEPSS